MKNIPFQIFLFLLIFCSCSKDKVSTPLTVNPIQLVEVPEELQEISGILFQDENTIISHNDSGNEPILYEQDLLERKIYRSVKIRNADNLDWEDIAEDQQYIYIGDFGNNLGQRTNLSILKIKKNEFNTLDSLNAEFIEFNFEDQADFTPRQTHNFDCEAMINFEDHLYLFSKNRADFKTKLYQLSKTADSNSANLVETFDVQGLITAATKNQDKNVIALLGYNDSNEFEPFIWLFYDFSGNQFFSGKSKRIELELNGQMEAACFGKDNMLYFTNESEDGNEAQFVFQLDCSSYL